MAEEVKVSLLEKSLSLSKNGGIYYGGARVEADERTAVLFVGLGGSGADALLRIKDQVKTRMTFRQIRQVLRLQISQKYWNIWKSIQTTVVRQPLMELLILISLEKNSVIFQ